MQLKHKTDNCDPQRLEAYLDDALGEAAVTEVEEHLSTCAACCEQLECSAANQEDWQRTQSLLRHDDFDHGLVESMFTRSELDTESGQGEAAMLSREIQGWLDPTDDPKSLGRFAGYEIVGIVGHGGMGIVLKGVEASLNRFVAIKVLAPRLATNGSARKRFAREAQAAAAVRHDNVIAIHRVDQWHGLPFLVMPYIGGVSLQKRIDAEGPLSIEQTLRVGVQIAAGLAAAHAQGLVHRDIKPANILLEQGVERVTITDFGLARAADDASVTRTGVIAGTPQYMSPEQAEAKRLDARSDLFSLGSVLYVMATGRPPFRGEGSFEVLNRIVNDPTRSMREIEPTVPKWFERLVSQLHAKSPEERPQSAEEVAELLRGCLAHVHQPEAMPLPQRLDVTKPNQPPGGSPQFQRNPPARVARLIAAVAFVFAMIFAGILIVLELNKGKLTIESDADDVPIRIMQGDKVVEKLTVSKEGASVRIAAGKYVVKIDGDPDGLTVEGGTVNLKRNGKEIARIVHSQEKGGSETVDLPTGGGNDGHFSAKSFTNDSLLKLLKERDRQFDNMTVLVRTGKKRAKVGPASELTAENLLLDVQSIPKAGERIVAVVTADHRLTVRGNETTIDVDEKVAGDIDLGTIPQHTRTSNASGKQITFQRIPASGKMPARTSVTRMTEPNGLLEQDRVFMEFCLGVGYGKRIDSIQSIEQAGDKLKVLAKIRLYDFVDELSQATLFIDKHLLVREARLQTRDEKDGLLSEIQTAGLLKGSPAGRSVARVAYHKRWIFFTDRNGKPKRADAIDAPYETLSIKFDLSPKEYETLTQIDVDQAQEVLDITPEGKIAKPGRAKKPNVQREADAPNPDRPRADNPYSGGPATIGGYKFAGGPTSELASYLSPDATSPPRSHVVSIIERAHVITLYYERDTPSDLPDKDSDFALSLKGSHVTPLAIPMNRIVVADGNPFPPKVGKTRPGIELVFSKFYGNANDMTPGECLEQMKRPIAADYKLKSINIVFLPPPDIKRQSFDKCRTVVKTVFSNLKAIQGDFKQLNQFPEADLKLGAWNENSWPKYARLGYLHDVGRESKVGREKLSNDWCALHISIGPITGNPRQVSRPTRKYPKQSIAVEWFIESGNADLNKKFNEIVTEALKELDALEVKLPLDNDSETEAEKTPATSDSAADHRPLLRFGAPSPLREPTIAKVYLKWDRLMTLESPVALAIASEGDRTLWLTSPEVASSNVSEITISLPAKSEDARAVFDILGFPAKLVAVSDSPPFAIVATRTGDPKYIPPRIPIPLRIASPKTKIVQGNPVAIPLVSGQDKLAWADVSASIKPDVSGQITVPSKVRDFFPQPGTVWFLLDRKGQLIGFSDVREHNESDESILFNGIGPLMAALKQIATDDALLERALVDPKAEAGTVDSLDSTVNDE